MERMVAIQNPAISMKSDVSAICGNVADNADYVLCHLSLWREYRYNDALKAIGVVLTSGMKLCAETESKYPTAKSFLAMEELPGTLKGKDRRCFSGGCYLDID